MALSVSGHTLLDSPPWSDVRLAKGTVPGTRVSITADRDALPLYLHLGATLNRIEPLERKEGNDCWGYAYKAAAAGNGARSDHEAGKAVDFWAARWGAHTWPPKMSKSMANKVLAALLRYRTRDGRRVFGWGAHVSLGGDYTKTVNNDPMHVYVRPGITDSDLRDCADRLGIRSDGTQKPVKVEPVPVPPANAPRKVSLHEARTIAKIDGHRYPGACTRIENALVSEGLLPKDRANGVWNHVTTVAYERWQKRCKVTADGIPGKASLTALGKRHGFTVIP